MEDIQLNNAEFEKKALPFESSQSVKELIATLDGGQRQVAEEFVYALGSKKADVFLQSMTPEKLKLFFEVLIRWPREA